MDAETYTRTDGLFGWRLVAGNGEIVATDGGQGYTERNDAREGFQRVAAAIVELIDGTPALEPDEIQVREAP